MIKNIFINNHPTQLHKLINSVLLSVIVCVFVKHTFVRLGVQLNFGVLTDYKIQFYKGFMMTIIISFFSLGFSFIIGVITILGSRSKIVILSCLSSAYVQIIRGTPLLVQIFFFYYIVGTAWGIENRYIAGVLILSLFEGAYISEIIRGGLASIDKQQYDIAKVIGLSNIDTLRLVVIPQLIMRTMPALAGQSASIIKDSSLLSVVAIIELTQTTQEISAINYALFENYLFLGVIYFVLTFPIILLSKYLEKKFRYAY